MKKCGHNNPCGCNDAALLTQPSCNTIGCPEPEPCSELFQAGCIQWTGANLICDSTVIATTGDRLTTILERMVALSCLSINPPEPVVNEDFTLTIINRADDFQTTYLIELSNEIAATPDLLLIVDRDGYNGVLTTSIAFTNPAANAAFSLQMYSNSVSSTGVITQSNVNEFAPGTSRQDGELIYNGNFLPLGTYVGVVTVTNGTLSRYKRIEINII